MTEQHWQSQLLRVLIIIIEDLDLEVLRTKTPTTRSGTEINLSDERTSKIADDSNAMILWNYVYTMLASGRISSGSMVRETKPNLIFVQQKIRIVVQPLNGRVQPECT